VSDRIRPRILVLAHLPPPIHGVTVVNETLVKSRLLHERFRLDVLPMRFARDFSDIGSLRLSKFLAMAGVALQLAFRLAFRRPDAVYMTPTPTGMSFVRDALFASIMNLFLMRKIFHLHGKGVRAFYDRSPFYRLLYRWVFRGAHIVHLSKRLAGDVAGIVPDARIHVVANGIAAPAHPVRRGDAAHSGPPVLLYLSNIMRAKGIFVLLDALKILTAEGVDFRVDFAGAPNDAATQQEFLDICAAVPLQGRAAYAGIVTGDAKDRLFRGADIFVMPTLNDAFPLVALEAMAYALPVVCSEEGSLPDIVRDGETGILVAKGDAPALAAALKSLLLDPDRRRRMGEAGRARYEANFTLDRMEENLAAALDDCLAAWHRPTSRARTEA
jgi:glycosyltransferase involved in cell wall biosynthesis